MVVLLFVVLCILVSVLHRLTSRAGPKRDDVHSPPRGRRRGGAVPNAEMLTYPDRVQDRWTALDDRQLKRLLDDSAPC